MTKQIELIEVGPRDGLQNEPSAIATSDKIKLVNLLSDAGFSTIEVTSFVSPQWVPQLADAHEVMTQITRKQGIRYIVLTPNQRGYDGAISANADEVAIFAAATETFSQKNINCSIEESLVRFEPVLEQAHARNLPVRGYISCVVGCPYEGDVSPQAVKYITDWMLARGCYEVSLGDTIGCGTPQTISTLLETLTADIPAKLLAGHYHDTNGRAIENVMTSIEFGLRRFDSAIAGLGGCPYAPGAKGNVSTNALNSALTKAGWHTGLDADRLHEAATFISTLVTPR